MIGIYIITNSYNGKIYVGSSIDIVKRWSVHKAHLRHGKHVNNKLQMAWNKYGEGVFEWDIIEQVTDIDKLTSREQCWLDYFWATPTLCYNITKNAECPNRGRPMSECQKLKISKAMKGRTHNNHPYPYWIIGYWKGKHLSQEHKQNISKANKGKKRKPLTKEHKQKLSGSHSKPYPSFINKTTGEIIPAGTNLRQMCLKYGLETGNMAAVKAGKVNHCKGWYLA